MLNAAQGTKYEPTCHGMHTLTVWLMAKPHRNAGFMLNPSQESI